MWPGMGPPATAEHFLPWCRLTGWRSLSLFPHLPLLPQNTHDDRVPVAAFAKILLPQHALLLEADLLVSPHAARVVLVHLEPDAVQVQRLEGVLDHQVRRLGAVTLVPLLLDAQDDAETCV